MEQKGTKTPLIPSEVGKGQHADEIESYHIYVKTADVRLAGTDAKVYINLFGKKGQTGIKSLEKSVEGGDTFKKGKTDEFILRDVQNVGKITKIKIGHNNTGAFAGWMLEYVEVKAASQRKKLFFPCNMWLADNEGDGKTERELWPVEKDETETYRVYVKTGNVIGAGTNGQVYINLIGEDGETGVKVLENSVHGGVIFKSGNTDEFILQDVPKVGEITTLIIGLHKMGNDPTWFLAHVDVEAPSLSKVLHFPLYKMLPDRQGRTERKLRPVNIGERETYQVSVKTADVKGAGTNSKVFINLYGEKGVSGLKFLDNPVPEGDKFERGSTDVFILHNVKNVGEITRIKIGHDSSGSNPGWLLSHVEIEAASLKKNLFFPCNMWLADNEGDGKTERELEPVEKPETETYHVYVKTADLKGAGTDCKVYINLIGENGQTGVKMLENPEQRQDIFKPGNKDEFILQNVPKVGDIVELIIGHDKQGRHPRWFLSYVEVEGSSLSKKLHFPYHKMLGGDGKTEQTLRPVELHDKETYYVSVKTADVRMAGTSSKVYIQLFGKKGATGLKVLEKSLQEGDNFEQGNKDVFILQNVQNVGEITKVKIGHDNSGSFAGWKLSYVEVDALSLRKKLFFPCNMWLAEDEGDGKTERELAPDVITTDSQAYMTFMLRKFSLEEETRVLLKSLLSKRVDIALNS